MGLCMEPCCNAEARAALHAANQRAFEEWEAAKRAENAPVIPAAPTPAENDISFKEALARIEANPRVGLK